MHRRSALGTALSAEPENRGTVKREWTMPKDRRSEADERIHRQRQRSSPTSRLSGAPALERCSAVAQDLRHRRSRPAELAGDLVLVQPLGRKLEDALPFGVGPGACANVLQPGGRPHDEREQLQSVDSGVLAENLERRRGARLQAIIWTTSQVGLRD
jgi:hypothetical protein